MPEPPIQFQILQDAMDSDPANFWHGSFRSLYFRSLYGINDREHRRSNPIKSQRKRLTSN